jgi:hypothetical protein
MHEASKCPAFQEGYNEVMTKSAINWAQIGGYAKNLLPGLAAGVGLWGLNHFIGDRFGQTEEQYQDQHRLSGMRGSAYDQELMRQANKKRLVNSERYSSDKDFGNRLYGRDRNNGRYDPYYSEWEI